MGYRQLTAYNNGIVHLDAQNSSASADKRLAMIYAESRNRLIFRHRFIYIPRHGIQKLHAAACVAYSFFIQALFRLGACARHRDMRHASVFFKGMADAVRFITCREYRRLPEIVPCSRKGDASASRQRENAAG